MKMQLTYLEKASHCNRADTTDTMKKILTTNPTKKHEQKNLTTDTELHRGFMARCRPTYATGSVPVNASTLPNFGSCYLCMSAWNGICRKEMGLGTRY